MAPQAKAASTVELPCGCLAEIESHGGKRVVGKCAEADRLFRETKAAGERSFDRSVKGAAKVALCHEADRSRIAFREHVGLGA